MNNSYITNCARNKFSRVCINSEDIEEISQEIELLSSSACKDNTKHLKEASQKYLYQFLLKHKQLFSILKKVMRQLEDIVLIDHCIANIEENSCLILNVLEAFRFFIRVNVDHPSWVTYNIFKESVTKFSDFEENHQMKLVASANNKQESALSAYLHLYFEMLWLWATMEPKAENIKPSLEHSLTELIFINFKQYERNKNNLCLCKCLKVIWVKLQIYCDNTEGIEFWEILNSILASYPDDFSVIFINFQAYLQCYNSRGQFEGTSCIRIKENLEFFNQKWSLLLKNLNNGHNERAICDISLQIESLITDLWADCAKLDFLYCCWDHYYKKLECIKLEGNINQILKSLDCNNEQGFLIFLRILKKYLTKHPQLWNRFKGRIYTRFPPAKFVKLSDQGIENLLLIFFAVSFVNFDEVIHKILELLSGLTSKQQCSPAVWNIYLLLIQESLDSNQSVEKASKKLLQLLQEVSSNRSQFHLIKLFVDHLQEFFSGENLSLQQNVLLGGWMESYLKTCEFSDLVAFLNVAAFIIRRIVNAGVWYEYQQHFATILLPILKSLSASHEIIGTVAALIVAHTNYPGFNYQNYIESFSAETGNKTVSFFTSLVNNSSIININSSGVSKFFIRSWFQCWILGVQNTEFTNATFELINLEANLEDSPFEQFLIHVESHADKELILNCCVNLERQLTKNFSLEMYANMGLVFNFCGSLLYSTNNSNCRLSKFIDLILLPLDVLRGKKPGFLPHVEKTWHLFVVSLMKISDDDLYIQRVLKDLIIKYLPLFADHKPFLKLLNYNEPISRFAYNKLNAEYFQYGISKCNDEHLGKVLNSLLNLIDDLSEEQLELFSECLLIGLFEVYIFKNHKVVAINIFKKLGAKDFLKDSFEMSILSITKKHLVFSANNYFQLLFVLTKIVRSVVREFVPKLKDEIHIVECKRGQGFDNHLRQNYDKLKKLCNC